MHITCLALYFSEATNPSLGTIVRIIFSETRGRQAEAVGMRAADSSRCR